MSDPFYQFDEQRYTSLLNFWYVVKKVRDNYREPSKDWKYTRVGEMTASEAIEQVHRLIEEYEKYIHPQMLLENRK